MVKKTLIFIFLLNFSFESLAQKKLNDTIGGITFSSHRFHRKNSPFVRFKTMMYFINIEDKYVLCFEGFQAVMDAKLQSISMVDSVINLTYCGFNRKLEKGFTETITYDMREKKFNLQRGDKRHVHKKIDCEFSQDQAWYMVLEN